MGREGSLALAAFAGFLAMIAIGWIPIIGPIITGIIAGYVADGGPGRGSSPACSQDFSVLS